MELMGVRIEHGDCREVLAGMAPESVQCVITSPPYFGLRDYKSEPLVWGDGLTKWIGQLGLEPTAELYVEHIVECFRAVKRVLRADGVLWLNMGDSYAGSWGAQGHRMTESDNPSWHGSQIKNHPKRASHTGTIRQAGLKPKDMMLLPFEIAKALRGDGWWLRSDIIWTKPNPMPESVTDRPTSAHEHIFLLSKAARYFYDAEAVRELTGNEADPTEYSAADGRRHFHEDDLGAGMSQRNPAFKSLTHPSGRNLRNVWEIATASFPEAHFATFPTKLVVPMVKAGSRKGDMILDPFSGAGTVGLVADRLGRNAILIDNKAEYCDMARERLEADAGMFAEVG